MDGTADGRQRGGRREQGHGQGEQNEEQRRAAQTQLQNAERRRRHGSWERRGANRPVEGSHLSASAKGGQPRRRGAASLELMARRPERGRRSSREGEGRKEKSGKTDQRRDKPRRACGPDNCDCCDRRLRCTARSILTTIREVSDGSAVYGLSVLLLAASDAVAERYCAAVTISGGVTLSRTESIIRSH